MANERVDRRLAAVLAADVAGYSRLMGVNEVGTLEALKARRREIVDPAIADHNGRIVKTTGDGLLVEFASAVDAVNCAVLVQEQMAARNGDSAVKFGFRIGINVGDIIVDDGDIFGDGVNVAARVENECEPGGVYLSEDAFRHVRGKTSLHFDDLGERTLKNIDRPIRVYAARKRQPDATCTHEMMPAEPQTSRKTSSDRPSIAVLPLQNMSGDPEQEYFADGLTENLTTDLSRFRELFVIGRNTAFTYKGKSIDLQRVGRELGVKYLLEGSVQRSGERMRINVQLIDVARGGHIWAERFDRDRSDLFLVQDEISRRVAYALSVQLRRIEVRYAEARKSNNPDSVDLVLRGYADALAGTEVGKLKARLQLFEQAVSVDPDNGDALVGVARNKANLVFAGWSQSPTEDLNTAFQYAERAIDIDQDHALAWFSKGQVLLARRDFAGALECYERAVGLNPSQSGFRQLHAIALICLGRAGEAFEPIQEAIRISPRDFYIADYYMTFGWAYWELDRFQDAIEQFHRSIAQNPKIEATHFLLASSFKQLGREDEGQEAVRAALAINPVWTAERVKAFYPVRPPMMQRLTDDLIKLGLPER